MGISIKIKYLITNILDDYDKIFKYFKIINPFQSQILCNRLTLTPDLRKTVRGVWLQVLCGIGFIRQ